MLSCFTFVKEFVTFPRYNSRGIISSDDPRPHCGRAGGFSFYTYISAAIQDARLNSQNVFIQFATELIAKSTQARGE